MAACNGCMSIASSPISLVRRDLLQAAVVRWRRNAPLEDRQQTLESVDHALSAEPGDLMAHPNLEEHLLPGHRRLHQPVAPHRTIAMAPAVRPRTRLGILATLVLAGW